MRTTWNSGTVFAVRLWDDFHQKAIQCYTSDMTNHANVFWSCWLTSIFVMSIPTNTALSNNSSNISVVQRISLSWTCPIFRSFGFYWMIPVSMEIWLSYHDKNIQTSKHAQWFENLEMVLEFWPIQSLSGAFLKYRYPQIIHFYNGMFPCKPAIGVPDGNPYLPAVELFWKKSLRTSGLEENCGCPMDYWLGCML